MQFDGAHIVSGSLDTSIRVWDAESGNCLHTLMGHQSLTSGMELRDNILVSGNADSTVKIWDIKTGQCLQTLQGEGVGRCWACLRGVRAAGVVPLLLVAQAGWERGPQTSQGAVEVHPLAQPFFWALLRALP